MIPALQIIGQEHDQENDQDHPDEPTASGQRIISTLVADTSPKYSENQNDDED